MALSLSTFNTTTGCIIYSPNGHFSAIASADMNGDGFKELVFGVSDLTPSGRGAAGAVYVVDGKNFNCPLSGTLDLSTYVVAGTGCFMMGASAGDNTGWSVSNVGTLLSTSSAESIQVGAYGSAPLSRTAAGVVWLIKGSANFCSSGTIDLASANPVSVAVKFLGAHANDGLGSGVSGPGDYDGNGYNDLMMSAWGTGSNTGKGFIYYNDGTGFNSSTVIDTLSISYPAGITISGNSATTQKAFLMASAGFFNNDNITDIVLANAYDSSFANGGSVYVLIPPVGGFTGNQLLFNYANAAYPIANGFYITGGSSFLRCGQAISSAGKFDGVNNSIALSCPPSIFVVSYDNSTLFNPISLSTTLPANVQRIDGASGSTAGNKIASGKLNNDNNTDLIVGAYQFSPPSLTQAGDASVVYGTPSLSGTITNLSPQQGIDVYGDTAFETAGNYVGIVGDLNQNGIYGDYIVSTALKKAYFFCGDCAKTVSGGGASSSSSTGTSMPSSSSSSTSSLMYSSSAPTPTSSFSSSSSPMASTLVSSSTSMPISSSSSSSSSFSSSSSSMSAMQTSSIYSSTSSFNASHPNDAVSSAPYDVAVHVGLLLVSTLGVWCLSDF